MEGLKPRTCKAYNNLGHVGNTDGWAGLSTVFVVESHVYEKTTGKERTEQRSYISSLPADAKILNHRTRKHWAVENNLHWVLDVTFGEDASRKRKQNEAENFNIVLKSVMVLLSNDKSKKVSKKNKRFKAALNHKYREKLLGF